MKKCFFTTFILIVLVSLCFSQTIDERLIRLEEGQKSIVQRLDKVEMNIEKLDAKIDFSNQQLRNEIQTIRNEIQTVRNEIKTVRDDLTTLFLWGFGMMLTGMFTIVGFTLWDRRSLLNPIVREQKEINKQIDKTYEQTQKLISTLKELGKEKPEILEAMKKAGIF
ncbi:hypothetical protein IT568_02995 [bacterium]|nr:hypothetical protein [bacterium]